MKNKTALKQSKSSIRFLFPVVLAMVALFLKFPSWQLGAVGGFLLPYLLMDIINLIYIKKKSKADAAYLDKKIDA
jgi:hypothetical protein